MRNRIGRNGTVRDGTAQLGEIVIYMGRSFVRLDLLLLLSPSPSPSLLALLFAGSKVKHQRQISAARAPTPPSSLGTNFRL